MSSICRTVIDESVPKCDSDKDFVTLQVVGGSGLCLPEVADICDNILQEAAEGCESNRSNKIVNFILVDYPEKVDNSVVDVAYKLNKERN